MWRSRSGSVRRGWGDEYAVNCRPCDEPEWPASKDLDVAKAPAGRGLGVVGMTLETVGPVELGEHPIVVVAHTKLTTNTIFTNINRRPMGHLQT